MILHIHTIINDICSGQDSGKLIKLEKIMKEYIWYISKTHYRCLSTLPIKESGISTDGYPFIKLDTGKIFYGHFPTDFQHDIYRYFIDNKIRKKIPEETIAVAYDVLFRYFSPKFKMAIKQRFYSVREGDVVLEAGAYIGYSTMKFSELVGENGIVISVEPVRENMNILLKNIKENSIKNVIAVNKAAWNKTTTLDMYVHNQQQNSLLNNIINNTIKRKERVNADSVENILGSLGIDYVDYANIEVNGAEIEVLQGMENLLKNHSVRHLAIAALYKRHGIASYRIVSSILKEKGYKVRIHGGNVYAYCD